MERFVNSVCRAILSLGASLVSVALAGCSPESGGTRSEPASADRGEQVFIENCSVCHGAEGRGPALAEIRALSSSTRREKIRSHPIAGQIPQRLPANQLADVIEFFETE